MKRWILRVGLWMTAIIALLIAAVVVFTLTPAFNRLARDRILRALNEAIHGEIHVADIEGAIWTGLTLHDLRIDLDDESVLSASKLVVDYNLLSLACGGLEVTGIELVKPVVHLNQNGQGDWNIAQVFAAGQPEPTPPTEWGGVPIRIDASSIAIIDGRIEVADGERTYVVDDLSVNGNASFEGVEIDAAVRRADARLTTGGAPIVKLESDRVSYLADQSGWRMAAERIIAQTGASRIATEGGVVVGGEALRVNGEVRLQLSAAEVRQFFPSVPLRADVSGEVHAEGPPAEIDVGASLTAAGATLSVQGRADLDATSPTFAGEVKVDGASIERLLTIDGFGGMVAAELKVRGSGTGVDDAVIEGSTTVGSLRIGASVLGDAQTQIRLRGGRLHTEGSLVGEGALDWEATIGLERETYDAVIETRQLDLGDVAPESVRLEGQINLRARVDGRGFDPATMDTRFNVDLRPSRVGPVDIAGGTIAGRLSQNRVDLADLRLRASGATLAASGTLGLAADAQTQLRYDLDMPNLEPWLAMVRESGDGSVTLTGTATGTLDALDTSGSLQMSEVRVRGIRVSRGTAEFDLKEIGARSPWPGGKIRVSLSGVDAGQPIQTLEANVDLQGTDPPQARVEVDAVMWEDRAQRLRAEVTLAPENTIAELQEIVLNVPMGTWKLAQPAQIVYGDDRIAVDNLRLENAAQSLSLDGAIAADGGEQLTVRAQDVQLAVIEPFVGTAIRGIRGDINAQLIVGGTPAQPQPAGALTLAGGRAHFAELNVTVEEAALQADLSPDRIVVSDFAAKAGDGRLRASGAIALRDGHAESLDLNLTASRWPAIHTRHYDAVIAADLHAGGQIDAPRLTGTVEVLEADIRPDFALLQENEPPPRDPTIIVVGLDESNATTGEGGDDNLEATAALLKALTLDVTLDLKRNTWVKRDASALELTGTLEFEKSAGDPTPSITGSVQVQRGWIYLYGRRFEPQRGIVTFTGGREVEPSLDIELHSRVGEYEVRTIVGGTVSKPTLAFESTPRLEEADVLAVLMFGRPVSELGQGEQVALERQAANIAAGYVAGRIGRAVGEALGFQISEIDVESRRVGVGRYLTSKTYVSVNQEFAGEAGREVRIEYFLTPRWIVRTETDSEGESGVDIFWQREY